MGETKKGNATQKVRPLASFGLRLGLMVSFMLIGVTPLIKVYVAFRLNWGQERVVMDLPFDIWSQTLGIASILTLITTVMAWRGYPPSMRWVYQAIILITVILICAEAAVRYYSDCDTCLIQINQDFMNQVFRVLIPLQIGVVVYMIWYMNRPPAKRFYQR